jgi:hypothetical protein
LRLGATNSVWKSFINVFLTLQRHFLQVMLRL